MKFKMGSACVACFFAIETLFGVYHQDGSAQSPDVSTSSESSLRWMIPQENWSCGLANGIPSPESGELLFEADIKLAQIYDVGQTQYGHRKASVIESGVISGEHLNGVVLGGGLDYELTLSNGVLEIEQILILKTDDGKNIYVRNGGVGQRETDVRVVFDFEAPNSSKYAWLNTGIYVSRRFVDSAAKTMKLRVFDTSKVKGASVEKDKFWIDKPTGMPEQFWEYRKAETKETRGEEIENELVTLGPSVSVGPSKRGVRNIIPITGGTLTGKIPGKVLFGGADYQNLSNPATIDARYLWQTSDGEIIIVRNAGTFGSLVPTFEARADGKYAWLNAGLFLSSSPGMGPGGVRLSFYESK